MKHGHPPYIKFYVDDYLGSTSFLTLEEHGAYLLLLWDLVRNNGTMQLHSESIPRALQRKCTTEQWKRIWEVLEPFFDVQDGFISQKRLSIEIEKYLEISEKRSKCAKQRDYSNPCKSNASDPITQNSELTGIKKEDSYESSLELADANSCSDAPASEPDCPPSDESGQRQEPNNPDSAPKAAPKPRKKPATPLRLTNFNGAPVAISEAAERIYHAYPKQVGKGAALPAIEKAIRYIMSLDHQDMKNSIETRDWKDLLRDTHAYAQIQRKKGTDPQYIPLPSTWFNQKRWEDQDLLRWQTQQGWTNPANPQPWANPQKGG
jgi:uncharacterized protein YdaU (DUF1376 family)